MLTVYARRPARLSQAMDRLFEDAFVYPYANGSRLALPVDVAETDDGYVLSAVLPGLRAEDLKLEILGDTVTLSGELPAPEVDAHAGARWLLRERRHGKFERTLTLPAEVNGAEAQAALADGVLTVRLPKAEAAKRKTIKVNVK